MRRNPSMTEEDWECFLLWRAAPDLSESEIDSLEKQLRVDQFNMDVRVQLFGYYNKYEKNHLKHKNADKKLSEQVLWLIENRPDSKGFLGTRLMNSGRAFKPKTFGILRQAWLEQVSNFPMDGTVLGNAAVFIGCIDYETGSELIERAYDLQPTANWLGIFTIFAYFELWRSPELYKDKIREHIIDVGIRSLKTEPGGAPWMTCEFVSNAALSLGRLEVVRFCIERLRNMRRPSCDQEANAYQGLIALRENDLESAVELMLEMKPGYGAPSVVFRLAGELFDAGERESIVQLIKSLEPMIKVSDRDRWLNQIANDERPDFEKTYDVR